MNNNKDVFSLKKADAFALATVRNPIEGKTPLESITDYIVRYLPEFPTEATIAMANSIYAKAMAQIEAEEAAIPPEFSEDESENIRKLLKENAQGIRDAFRNEPNGEAFRIGKDPAADLLVAFTAHALSNYHPSGWIKYDKKAIIALARLSKLPMSEQEKLTQQLHFSFGIDMRVVGSAQPIPCYALPWLSPPKENTPVHLMGLENIYYALQTLLTKEE